MCERTAWGSVASKEVIFLDLNLLSAQLGHKFRTSPPRLARQRWNLALRVLRPKVEARTAHTRISSRLQRMSKFPTRAKSCFSSLIIKCSSNPLLTKLDLHQDYTAKDRHLHNSQQVPKVGRQSLMPLPRGTRHLLPSKVVSLICRAPVPPALQHIIWIWIFLKLCLVVSLLCAFSVSRLSNNRKSSSFVQFANNMLVTFLTYSLTSKYSK